MKVKLLIILITITINLLTCDQYSKDEMEEIISSSEIYSRIDKLCMEIPKPNDFKFEFKKFSGNSDLASISFHYSTEKNFDVVKQFYADWAKNNHWRASDYELNMYIKGDYSVIVAPAQSTLSDIAILCQEPQ